jgi:ABC-type branched-subunit amino acid transport system ATPase component
VLSKIGLINAKKESKLAEKYVDEFSIKTPSIEQLVMNLSGGNQQKVALAKCLSTNPKILILDEPTAGMSPTETNHIAELIRRLSRNLSVILIEHDMEVVMAISDKITVLHWGGVIAEGNPKEIQENKFVKEAYFGEEEG